MPGGAGDYARAMKRTARALFPVVALLAAACMSDPTPRVEAYWIPALSVIADEDPNEPGGDVHFDADLRTGDGWAARIGLHEQGSGFGLLYMTTLHSEKSASTTARTHAAYLEFRLSTDRDQEAPFFFGSLAAGAGAAIFEFSDGYDDTGAAAGMSRLEVGFVPVDRLSVIVSGGGFLWGYPTETIGYGAFLMLGVGLDL